MEIKTIGYFFKTEEEVNQAINLISEGYFFPEKSETNKVIDFELINGLYFIPYSDEIKKILNKEPEQRILEMNI